MPSETVWATATNGVSIHKSATYGKWRWGEVIESHLRTLTELLDNEYLENEADTDQEDFAEFLRVVRHETSIINSLTIFQTHTEGIGGSSLLKISFGLAPSKFLRILFASSKFLRNFSFSLAPSILFLSLRNFFRPCFLILLPSIIRIAG